MSHSPVYNIQNESQSPYLTSFGPSNYNQNPQNLDEIEFDESQGNSSANLDSHLNHDPYTINVASEAYLDESIQESRHSEHFHNQYEPSSPDQNANDSLHNFQTDTGFYPSMSETSAKAEDLGPIIDQENSDKTSYRRNSRIFMATSIVSAVLILVFEVYMFAVVNIHKRNYENTRYVEISIYLALFIFAALFQVVLTYIGLKTKNMLLLTMLCGFYICMLIYTGIQYQEVSERIETFLFGGWRRATRATNIATIAVIAVTLIVQAFLIFFVLRKNVNWFRFKKIGGDLKIRRMYSVFQIHRSLLIFDLFFFLGFTIQFIVIMVQRKSSVEFILTVCVLPLTFVVLLVSDFAATRELLLLSLLTTACFLGGCAYVLFKMIRLYTKYTSAYGTALNPGDYFPGRKSLITFGVLTLALLVSTIVVEIWVMRNYGRGLLPSVSVYYSKLPGHNQGRQTSTKQEMEQANTDLEESGGRKSEAFEDDSGSLIID
ncbi:uncharacterized protein RJT20DRAFT_53523 [Scheffersomyces xylosifermentans]|uniref:uncharacterized protein n=1 Tax=Scheffersomyces xylosifermentans TaxID=1304137 RepID=UPI00315CD1C2